MILKDNLNDNLKKALNHQGVDVDLVVLENESTNEYALKNIKDYPRLIVAKSQHNGQGRKGRAFISKPGGAYFSLQLSVPLTDFYPNKYVIISGLATAKALNFFNIQAQLKWPNDIIVKDKKAGGILCKSIFNNDKACVVMGIGINFSNDISELSDYATRLIDHNKDLNIEAIITKTVKYILEIMKDDFHQIIEEYKKYSNTLGRLIKVIDEEKTFNALAVDVSKDGYLEIEKDGIRHLLTIGDVSICQ